MILFETQKHSGTDAKCVSSRTYLKVLVDLIVMLHPLAPLFTCELWCGFSHVLLSVAPAEALQYLQSAPGWCYKLVSEASTERFPPILNRGLF